MFKRTVEDFTCEHCGTHVQGNGYTNHCPRCLWSKHVDIEPGDRLETCRGVMEPIAVEGSSPHYRIVQRCVKCGIVRRIDSVPEDNAEILLTLAKAAGGQ